MLGATTLVMAFLVLIFAEITPKVIGASYADKVALPLSFVLALFLATPKGWSQWKTSLES